MLQSEYFRCIKTWWLAKRSKVKLASKRAHGTNYHYHLLGYLVLQFHYYYLYHLLPQ